MTHVSKILALPPVATDQDQPHLIMTKVGVL